MALERRAGGVAGPPTDNCLPAPRTNAPGTIQMTFASKRRASRRVGTKSPGHKALSDELGAYDPKEPWLFSKTSCEFGPVLSPVDVSRPAPASVLSGAVLSGAVTKNVEASSAGSGRVASNDVSMALAPVGVARKAWLVIPSENVPINWPRSLMRVAPVVVAPGTLTSVDVPSEYRNGLLPPKGGLQSYCSSPARRRHC